jgi:hypothetical protein
LKLSGLDSAHVDAIVGAWRGVAPWHNRLGSGLRADGGANTDGHPNGDPDAGPANPNCHADRDADTGPADTDGHADRDANAGPADTDGHADRDANARPNNSDGNANRDANARSDNPDGNADRDADPGAYWHRDADTNRVDHANRRAIPDAVGSGLDSRSRRNHDVPDLHAPRVGRFRVVTSLGARRALVGQLIWAGRTGDFRELFRPLPPAR